MLVNNLILPYDYHNHHIFYPGRTNFLSLRAKSLTRFVITEIKQQMVGTDITTQNVQRGGGGESLFPFNQAVALWFISVWACLLPADSNLIHQALNSRHVASTHADCTLFSIFFWKRHMSTSGCAHMCMFMSSSKCVRVCVCGARSEWLGSTSKAPASLCINEALCFLPSRLQHVSPRAASVFGCACICVCVFVRSYAYVCVWVCWGHSNLKTKGQRRILPPHFLRLV